MTSLVRHATVCALLGAAAISSAIIRLDGTTDADYLSLGESMTSMARIIFDVAAKDYRSAVLIKDQWLLTAGHNFTNATVSRVVNIGGQNYTTVSWTRHPSYNGAAIQNGFDLCLVKLDRRVTPATISPVYAGAAERGIVGTIAGYGASGVGAQTFNDFLLRAGRNLVEGYYTKQLSGQWTNNWPNVLVTDFDNGTVAGNTADSGKSPFSNATPDPLEANFGSGDSGGGLFLTIGGTEYLAGVISARFRFDGGTNMGTYGANNIFSRTAPAASWIAANTLEPGLVRGNVTLSEFVGLPDSQTLTVQLVPAGGSTVSETQTLVLNRSGQYSFVTALRGVYDLYFKTSHWLKQKVSNVVINAVGTDNVNVTLRNGDIVPDNSVDLLDYFGLSDSYNLYLGDSGFNPMADLNGDDSVDLIDYFVLSDQYNTSGDDF